MSRFPGVFSNTLMCVGRQNTLIRLPEIAIRVTPAIGGRNPLPKPFTGLLAAIANHIGNDLACPAAHHGPQPALLRFTVHKTPGFVQFQNVIWAGGLDAFAKGRQRPDKRFNPCCGGLARHLKNAFKPS